MKRYLRTASRGMTLGAGLAVLWFVLGSHALFFAACVAIPHSVVLPVIMMRSIDTAGVSVLVRRQLVMMGKRSSQPRTMTINWTIRRGTSFLEQVFWFCQALEPHLHNA
jgi:hypothetical protein